MEQKETKTEEKVKELSKIESFWGRVKTAWGVLTAKNVFAMVDTGKQIYGTVDFQNKHKAVKQGLCVIAHYLDDACRRVIKWSLKDLLEEMEVKEMDALKRLKKLVELGTNAADGIDEILKELQGIAGEAAGTEAEIPKVKPSGTVADGETAVETAPIGAGTAAGDIAKMTDDLKKATVNMTKRRRSVTKKAEANNNDVPKSAK